jgi:UDP-GlcNAc:undecaprenyl-phosphate/decaprenyl-phosphate GlcNAc-1-phosphate transferase
MYSIILAFVTSFLLTFKVIPSIIHLSKVKKLYDLPDDRKVHSEVIPNLGGIAIFAGLLFSIILWSPFQYLGDLQYVLAAFIIVFLIGAKDDIEPITPYKKFGVELFAAFIIVFFANIRITGFYGIFGIEQIPFLLSIIFTIFVIIAIINAFNLVDGVNGLAGSIGVITAFTFGFWFYKVDRIELAVVAFAMIGAIVAFLYYNITPAKIFMGDTGSLLLGLISSVLAISFLEYNNEVKNTPFFIKSGPVFAMAVLVIPIFDTIRVMISRVFRKRSPFFPDRNHLHHLLLDIGFNHLQVTFILVITNIVFILIAFYLKYININLLLLILVLLALITVSILLFFNGDKLISFKKFSGIKNRK